MLKLQELGYTNAYALRGGITAWKNATYPTEEAPAAQPKAATPATPAAPASPAKPAPKPR